jgi:aminoglycoside phosphotransferase (APT) family kinase protein
MTETASSSRTIGVADPADIRRRASGAVGWALSDLTPLPGGTSSITYSARTSAGGRVVVKVAPPGLAPVRNRDVLRQARVLSALAAVPEVAVPTILGTEAGEPPEVPPLFVMSFAEGDSYEPRHTADGPGAPAERPRPEEVRARASSAASMLAGLHSVSPAALGIDEPDAGLAAEVARWRKAFGTCELGPEQRAAEERCHDTLLAVLPAAAEPAVLHGDWRLGNMQCVGATINAVIDWEIWSVGDPRLDLAWMRLMSDPAHPTAAAPTAPTLEPAELLAVYAEAAGRPVDAMGWFDALVRYKQAAASALLVKNAGKRGEDSPQIDRMRGGIGLLLEAALTDVSR